MAVLDESFAIAGSHVLCVMHSLHELLPVTGWQFAQDIAHVTVVPLCSDESCCFTQQVTSKEALHVASIVSLSACLAACLSVCGCECDCLECDSR